MILLARHGQTQWNIEGRLQGRSGSPLTVTGRQQAMNLLKFRGWNFANIFHSPLQRVLDTLELASVRGGQESPLLAEMSFGDCEGLTHEEIEQAHPGLFDERESDKWNFCWPNGESYDDVYNRAWLFVGSTQAEQGITLVVAHETINRMLAGVLLKLPPEKIMKLSQPNGLVWMIP